VGTQCLVVTSFDILPELSLKIHRAQMALFKTSPRLSQILVGKQELSKRGGYAPRSIT